MQQMDGTYNEGIMDVNLKSFLNMTINNVLVFIETLKKQDTISLKSLELCIAAHLEEEWRAASVNDMYYSWEILKNKVASGVLN